MQFFALATVFAAIAGQTALAAVAPTTCTLPGQPCSGKAIRCDPGCEGIVTCVSGKWKLSQMCTTCSMVNGGAACSG